MPELPTEWGALCALVLLLGARHGLDADHLATIDGLTRLNLRRGSRHARWCGSLFSLGHGAVVLTVALMVSLASARWQAPAWLAEASGALSIAFLLALGVANLRGVLLAAPGEVVAPVGLKGRFLGGLTGRSASAGRPWAVAAVGALFAVSFDTLSLSALFAVTALPFGGVAAALALGSLFVLGMLVTDGINGLWVSRLIARADSTAVLASRVMGLAVAGVSLLVAGLGLAKAAMPLADTWLEGRELLFGATVVAVIGGSYLLAHWLAARGRSGSAVPPARASERAVGA